ncbi:MAG: pyruvate dehydrogenase (acetyl-transferring) E1 component subunit alpha [Sulfurimonas sp.]
MNLTKEKAKEYYSKMLLIRRFEEKCVELYSSQKIRGFLHLYIGEEAVAVGLHDALDENDSILTTYREHGHALTRGVSAKSVMAELYGKIDGCSRGRGGSMHLFDAKTRFYGGSAIVGGGLPLAVGMALADKMQNNTRVTVAVFGDGAVAEGEFHEALNLAALWELPILFVCENNEYAMGTALKYTESQTEIYKKAESYNIHAKQVDGMDVLEVAKAAHRAVEDIKDSSKPVFLECLTYRFRAHSMFDAELYREKSEVKEWKEKGPLVIYEERLKELGLWSEIDAEAIEAEVQKVVDEAVEFAENSEFEPLEDLKKFVYSEVSNG